MKSHTPLNCLLRFCKAASIPAEAVRRAESLQGYQLSREIPAERLKHLTQAELEELIGMFGNSLSFRVGLADSPPLLELRRGSFTIDPQKALRALRRRDDQLPLNFLLEIDKAAFLAAFPIDAQLYPHALLYLFAENLETLLNAPLPELDGILFSAPAENTMVVVVDSDLHLEGSFLTIIGAGLLTQAATSAGRKLQYRRSLADTYYQVAAENLNWSGFRLKHLTPLHFLCQRKAGVAGRLDAIIARQLLHLCILYTANRTVLDEGRLVAHFAGVERSIALALDQEDQEAHLLAPLLARLARWPYLGRETDRITVFQTVVARELDHDSSEANYRAFKNRLGRLSDEARWHHRIFINGQIEKHFAQVQAVLQYVADVSKTVSDTLDTLTKGLTDTLLATVGVIVLTLLASLAEKETPGLIFRVGMWSYAAYLFIFQGLYRMGSIWHSYRLLLNETSRQLLFFEMKLDRKRVQEMSSPLNSRKAQFTRWFWLSAAIYAVVIGLIVWLGTFLPQFLGAG